MRKNDFKETVSTAFSSCAVVIFRNSFQKENNKYEKRMIQPVQESIVFGPNINIQYVAGTSAQVYISPCPLS